MEMILAAGREGSWLDIGFPVGFILFVAGHIYWRQRNTVGSRLNRYLCKRHGHNYPLVSVPTESGCFYSIEGECKRCGTPPPSKTGQDSTPKSDTTTKGNWWQYRPMDKAQIQRLIWGVVAVVILGLVRLLVQPALSNTMLGPKPGTTPQPTEHRR